MRGSVPVRPSFLFSFHERVSRDRSLPSPRNWERHRTNQEIWVLDRSLAGRRNSILKASFRSHGTTGIPICSSVPAVVVSRRGTVLRGVSADTMANNGNHYINTRQKRQFRTASACW